MRLLRRLLAPLGPLFRGAVALRNRVFDHHPQRAARVSVPVLSVGNLSTGGTGKTPVTLFLAAGLQAEGHLGVIVSRGYGGRRPVDPMAVAPETDPRMAGDEPVLMARRLGPGRVVVAHRRHAGALLALAATPRPDLLLLDDGFQHRALHRDLDLLLLDGVRRWGNGRMLPLGDLREPPEAARRAHALVVTRGSRAPRAEVEAWWARYGSGGPIFFLDFRIGALRRFGDGERLALPADPGPLFAVCALGHPEAFLADLLVAGLGWVGNRTYPDHRAIPVRDMASLQQAADDCEAEALVCTEKDAVKLGEAHLAALSMPLWIAEQEVVGGEDLLAFVRQRLPAPLPSAAPTNA